MTYVSIRADTLRRLYSLEEVNCKTGYSLQHFTYADCIAVFGISATNNIMYSHAGLVSLGKLNDILEKCRAFQ